MFRLQAVEQVNDLQEDKSTKKVAPEYFLYAYQIALGPYGTLRHPDEHPALFHAFLSFRPSVRSQSRDGYFRPGYMKHLDADCYF